MRRTPSTPKRPTHCFCRHLNELMAEMPSPTTTLIRNAIEMMRNRPRLSALAEECLFMAAVQEVIAAITSYVPLWEQLVSLLPAPLAPDCPADAYNVIAGAVAGEVYDFELPSIRIARSLRANLPGNAGLCRALVTLTPGARDTVLEVLYEALCEDDELAVPAFNVLEVAVRKESRLRDWLRCPFSGPRASALYFMSGSEEFCRRFQKTLKALANDTSASVRLTAVRAICRSAYDSDMERLVLDAFDDSDADVRYGTAQAVLERLEWTKPLLPELRDLGIQHGDERVRAAIGDAIGGWGGSGVCAAGLIAFVGRIERACR